MREYYIKELQILGSEAFFACENAFLNAYGRNQEKVIKYICFVHRK